MVKEPEEAESNADFTGKDALILGVGMGFAYKEGLEEAERRKLEHEMKKDDNKEDL